MFVDSKGNFAKGIRQAQANANSSGVPWVVFMYVQGVYCERATERDMAGESARVQDGGRVIEPEADNGER